MAPSTPPFFRTLGATPGIDETREDTGEADTGCSGTLLVQSPSTATTTTTTTAGKFRDLLKTVGLVVEKDGRLPELSSEEDRTVRIFERCAPSVCHIITTTEVVGSGPFGMNPEEVPQGSGSGFLWDAQGHVVTNFHVVKDARRALVSMSDQTTYQATLVGAEPDCDLAVLKLERPEGGGEGEKKKELVPLEVGGSARLRVGQSVLAIGNPFGLDQTLTRGIVSGLGREMTGVSGRTIRGLVQTDAAINPGNSGGPLLDSAGRLIGVNTMIASPSGAFAGVGFAIPVDTVARVVRQLVSYGHTIRPWLGLHCASPDLTRRVRGAEGIFILGVEEDGPAKEAGLIPCYRTSGGAVALGDEILQAGERLVRTPEDLMDAVEAHQIGHALELKIRRDRNEEPIILKVKLGTRPRSRLSSPSRSPRSPRGAPGLELPPGSGSVGGYVQMPPHSKL